MLVLTYITASDRYECLHRFSNLKAFMILDIIEAVFWLAAICISGLNIGHSHGVVLILGIIIMFMVIALL